MTSKKKIGSILPHLNVGPMQIGETSSTRPIWKSANQEWVCEEALINLVEYIKSGDLKIESVWIDDDTDDNIMSIKYSIKKVNGIWKDYTS